MRTLAVVLVVSALFASTAAVSVKHQRRWTQKLDVSLVSAAEQGTDQPVSVLIWVRSGASARIMSHLAQHGVRQPAMPTPDVILAQLPASMLRGIAADRAVEHVSADLTHASAN